LQRFEQIKNNQAALRATGAEKKELIRSIYKSIIRIEEQIFPEDDDRLKWLFSDEDLNQFKGILLRGKNNISSTLDGFPV
jgi:hypothetical protein